MWPLGQPSPYRGLSNEQRKVTFDEGQIRAWLADGRTLKQIAAIVGCSLPTIRKELKRLGVTGRPRGGLGADNANWRGGRVVNADGYVRVWVGRDNVPESFNGYVLEHRLVMQEHLGRPLEPHEVVHHINGVKTANRIENLTLMSDTEHKKHHQMLLRQARSVRDAGRASSSVPCQGAAC